MVCLQTPLVSSLALPLASSRLALLVRACAGARARALATPVRAPALTVGDHGAVPAGAGARCGTRGRRGWGGRTGRRSRWPGTLHTVRVAAPRSLAGAHRTVRGGDGLVAFAGVVVAQTFRPRAVCIYTAPAWSTVVSRDSRF